MDLPLDDAEIETWQGPEMTPFIAGKKLTLGVHESRKQHVVSSWLSYPRPWPFKRQVFTGKYHRVSPSLFSCSTLVHLNG
jgi:hypothetical protein